MRGICRAWAQWPLHLWFVLVGVSVLTTYQHHFIDIPTGALLGFLCLWLWPDRGPSPAGDRPRSRRPPASGRWRRAICGGGLIVALAVWIGGAGLWLLWPARVACARRRELRVPWPGRIPERRGRTHESRGASSARALSRRRLRQFARRGPGTNRRRSRSATASRSGAFPGTRGRRASPPSSISAPNCRGAATAAPGCAIPMLDLVAPQPAHCGRRGEHRARPRARAGAGLLRARLFAQRRRGRDLAR